MAPLPATPEPAPQPRPARTRVKICGVRTPGLAAAAVDAGADALGLVFAPRSPRRLTVEQARAVLHAVGPFVETVGLFVEPADNLRRHALQALDFSMLQLHGELAPQDLPALAAQLGPRRILKPLAFNDPRQFADDLARWAPLIHPRHGPHGSEDHADRADHADHAAGRPDGPRPDNQAPAPSPRCAVVGLLVDAPDPSGVGGGAGRTFDWHALRHALDALGPPTPPIVLAGGLNPENVADAVRAVRPSAVDVSSGVEVRRGEKDPAMVRAFCQAVQSVD